MTATIIGLVNCAILLVAGIAGAQVFVDDAPHVLLAPHDIARVSTTPGELEVAVSEDGRNIVVAVNDNRGNPPFNRPTVFFSSDGGQTFQPSTLDGLLPNRRDPTVVRAGSGSFYYAALRGGNSTSGAVLGRSDDGGQSFTFLHDLASRCVVDQTSATLGAANACSADQPHLAADPRPKPDSDTDQLYVVWRDVDRLDRDTNGDGRIDLRIGIGPEIQMISCSNDGGQTWGITQTVGTGLLSRIGTGPDGQVYVVMSSRRQFRNARIFLQRFSPCDQGLQPAFTVSNDPNDTSVPARHRVTLFNNVRCPVPGLDRCNSGNILSSPTVAVDRDDANIVYVTYAHEAGDGNEEIRTIVSLDQGETFTIGPARVSDPIVSRKYLPWSCGADGHIFVGWYDRRAASVVETDLTQYLVRSFHLDRTPDPGFSPRLRISTVLDATGNQPDPQCAAGWPHSPRNIGDSENCSIQPQNAGVCRPAGTGCASNSGRGAGCTCSRGTECAAGITCTAGFCIADARLNGGNAPRCDFSDPSCATGETCTLGRGAPKYGDYNGLACTRLSAFVAWASGTPPAGTTGSGFGVFHRQVDARRPPTLIPDICRIGGLNCNFQPRMLPGEIELTCNAPGCVVIDPVPQNCQRKFDCPGCRPGGRCPPEYRFELSGLTKAWTVDLVDETGKPVASNMKREGDVAVIILQPDKSKFISGQIGDYYFVFKMTESGVAKKRYRVKMSVSAK